MTEQLRRENEAGIMLAESILDKFLADFDKKFSGVDAAKLNRDLLIKLRGEMEATAEEVIRANAGKTQDYYKELRSSNPQMLKRMGRIEVPAVQMLLPSDPDFLDVREDFRVALVNMIDALRQNVVNK